MVKLKNISEVSEILQLTDLKTGKPNNYILRYWEKEFNEIKPKYLNGRRYYDEKQINIIKLIKFLLKDKGLTISGVKNVLKKSVNSLDDYNSSSLKASYYKKDIKNKTKTILNKIKRLKEYGKKNSY
tara:strand:- start:515 stop:895 length:381 start_codon:yes stop_codon:yes gene_type:complete